MMKGERGRETPSFSFLKTGSGSGAAAGNGIPADFHLDARPHCAEGVRPDDTVLAGSLA
jgi:hypothetical protein